jgi:hypothetical protein
MKYTVTISIIAAAMLAVASAASYADQGKGGGARPSSTPQVGRSIDRDRTQDRSRLEMPDRDQDQKRDMDKDRLRDRDRIHTDDPMQLADGDIYGGELMTAEERNQYRKELQAANTWQAKEKFQQRHEEKMMKRAENEGKDLVPPGQGKIYGGELMTVQERNEYRQQQRHYDGEGLEKFQAQHRELMQKRAAALGMEIEEAH